MATEPGPVQLPYTYWDGTVATELRTNAYPYGAGQPGTGVQITLEQRHGRSVIIAVRLPAESARRLALGILRSVGEGSGTREDDDA